MFKSLKMKLFILFFFVTILPMAFVAYITYQSQREDIKQQTDQLLFALGDSAAVSLDDFIQERLQDVATIAQNPVIQNPDSDFDDIQKELKKFVELNSIYFGAIFIDTDGIITVDVDDTVIGTDLSDRKWFQKTLRGGVHLSDIYISDVIDRQILNMSGSVQDENGRIHGVVSPSFDLQYLWRRIDLFTRQQQSIGLGGYAFLVNQNGDIVAHPNQDISGRQNFFEDYDLSTEQFNHIVQNRLIYTHEESEMLQTFVKLDKKNGFENDWYVGIAVPLANIQDPLNQLLTKYLILFSCVLLIVIIGVFKLSNYIVKPLQRLVFATSDFAFGKKVYPLSTNSYHEVDTLTRTFNMMMRRLVEREKSHQKSTLILETTDNGVLSFQKDSRLITTFNRTCEELFGVKKESVIGLKIDDFIKFNPAFQQFYRCAKLQGIIDKQQFNTQFEFLCKFKDAPRYFFMSLSPLKDLNNEQEFEGILLVFNDTTDKREMEMKLNRSEKLQMVGQLAAGFAHEIRNPLTTIRGFIQLFVRSDEVSESQKTHYDVIIKEIDRVNEIISELLNMANPNNVAVHEETDIVKLINEINILYKTEAEWRRVDFRVECESLPPVWIKKNKLHQILMNLVKNALEAIQEEGELTISAQVDPTESFIKLTVADNGGGMDPTTLAKLGTPFFTTKESGTGLGIITCYRLIEELGGTMEIESEQGKGTTFILFIPIER
ncbi:hypothetical protein BTS2_2778 [Bacillus sp. TS-2]|nr:hypothetical protein BTS2_2778 [Bacillus sp. TS-2]